MVVVIPAPAFGPMTSRFQYRRNGKNDYNKGFPVSLGFGKYNFVDVRDVADGMIAAAEKHLRVRVIFFAVKRFPLMILFTLFAVFAVRKSRKLHSEKVLSILPLRLWKSITKSVNQLRFLLAMLFANSFQTAIFLSKRQEMN